MIKVSIVVPIYNTGKYLPRCIESLLNQTLKEIEIILINDGSKEDIDSIIKKYKDERIKYIKKENEGIGKTRNLGISLAKGEYIMFVDSDDFVEEYYSEKLYNEITKTNSDVVISNYFEVINGNKKEKNYPYFNSSNLKDNPEILNKINLSTWNKIYKASLIKNNDIKFDEKLKFEDVPFIVKSLECAQKISKINDFIYDYIIHENSETTTIDKRMFDIFKITDITFNILNKEVYKKERTNLLVQIITYNIMNLRNIRDIKTKIKFINIAFKKLKEYDKNWKKCEYIKIVKKNKLLTTLYCITARR